MVANACPSNAEAAVPNYPNANVLVEGFRTPIPRVSENGDAIRNRERAYFRTLCPRNYFHAWLADDVALMTLRLERCARIERRERDRIALRAEFFWDDDRRSEAEEIGARLASDPARTVDRLRKTPQGCDWLIRRWVLLAREANRAGRWDEVQTALAFDLLGTPEGFRNGTPGLPLDEDGGGRQDEGAVDLASVARREIAALRERRVAVGEADALDRALAMSDMTEQSTPELRRLRRYEATLHKRLRWDLHQLQIDPKHHSPNPNLEYLYEPKPEPAPVAESAPTPTDSAPASTPAPEPEPEPETPEGKEPGPGRRPEPRQLKERARRDARKRRADRLDN